MPVGVDRIHIHKQNSLCDNAHVHNSTCVYMHFYMMKACSKFSIFTEMVIKKRETKNTHIQHIFYIYKYILHCLPLKYFNTPEH